MIIRQILHWAREELKQTSPSPVLDAELLLRYVLKCDAAFLLAHDDRELTGQQEGDYRQLVQRRLEGMPVQYVIGKKEFYRLEFEVGEGVLVPRVDTEVLVEMVLGFLKSKIQIQNFQTNRSLEIGACDLGFSLVDVGTGTGCIPIAILKNCPDLKGVGLDVSLKALDIAQKNAQKLGVSDRLKLIESDLLKNLPEDAIGDRDWILTANLPYLPDDWPKHSSTEFEPDLALFGGERGVELYRRLAGQIESLKNKPKALFFECFTFQVQEIESFLPSYPLIETRKMTGEACGMHFSLRKG